VIARPIYILTNVKLTAATVFTGLQAGEKSIKGHAYVYRAEPVRDRRSWTPLMATLMENAGNPSDASPFSAPVVAEVHWQPAMLA
jgi:hypothetical protein